MKYYVVQPPTKLAKFVRFFWVFEDDTILDTPYIYRSMADGCAEMIFHYQGSFKELTDKGNIKQSYSLIHGQSQVFRRFITNENFGIFGVYLYPFTIPLLFNIPSYAASNQMPDMETLLGAEGKELEKKMMLAPGNSKRVEIVSHFLEKRLLQNPLKDTNVLASINYVIHSKGVANVQQLAEKFNLSTRQFERKFKEYSGFSPKLFSRIIRFQAALKEYENRKYKSLTEITHECGYYDQSHFIHDFKAFSGYHPKHYFSGKAEGVEFREA